MVESFEAEGSHPLSLLHLGYVSLQACSIPACFRASQMLQQDEAGGILLIIVTLGGICEGRNSTEPSRGMLASGGLLGRAAEGRCLDREVPRRS